MLGFAYRVWCTTSPSIQRNTREARSFWTEQAKTPPICSVGESDPDKYHSWINASNMIRETIVGTLDYSTVPSANKSSFLTV